MLPLNASQVTIAENDKKSIGEKHPDVFFCVRAQQAVNC